MGTAFVNVPAHISPTGCHLPAMISAQIDSRAVGMKKAGILANARL
jgi:hypothetical protein